MLRFIFLSVLCLVSSCASQRALLGKQTSLHPSDKKRLMHAIWQNESAGQVEGLTSWNHGENFASLGIGHFIWYSQQARGIYRESFPAFVRFATAAGHPPAEKWIYGACPWRTKRDFDAAKYSLAMRALRRYLVATLDIQTDFIIARSEHSLQKILAQTPAELRQKVALNYQKVASTANGMYALIDYVNFKGEGTSAQERYKGVGWGLKEVLLEMAPSAYGQSAARAFSQAAKRVLNRRIAHAPASRREERWRAGWMARVESYAKPW